MANKPPKLLVATNNQGKLEEFESMLRVLGIEILSPKDIGVQLDVEETGTTYEENALLKSTAFARETGLPTIADDSGLEVSALDSAPGVYSARWHPGSDHDRNVALFEKLKSESDRKAEFVACLSLYDPTLSQNNARSFIGVCKGSISADPKSLEASGGFGYDPLFIPDGYEHSFAQLGESVKSKISHRARALQKLFAYFSN